MRRRKSARSLTSSALFAFLMLASSRSSRRSTVARSARIELELEHLRVAQRVDRAVGVRHALGLERPHHVDERVHPAQRRQVHERRALALGDAGHVDVLDGGERALLRLEDLRQPLDARVGDARDPEARLGTSARERRGRSGEELEESALARERQTQDAGFHPSIIGGVESRLGDAARPRLSRATGGSCAAGPRRPLAAAPGRRPRHPVPGGQLRLAAPARPRGRARASAREDVRLPEGAALPPDPVRRKERGLRRRRLALPQRRAVDGLLPAPSPGPASWRQGYPKGTELKLVLVTDAIVDPDPKDWPDVPPGWDARSHSMRKTVELVREMQIPLYVMLIGDPAGDVAGRDREQSPGFVLDLVQAANGAAAAPLAQTVAAFFKDDGVLLRKFVYRVAPTEGLAKIEPVVRRIAAPAARRYRVQDLRLLRAAAAADPGGAPGPAGALVPRPRRPGGGRAGGGQAGARGHGQDPPGSRRHLVGPGALARRGPAHGRRQLHAAGARARPHGRRPRHERARPARRRAAAGGPRRRAPGARGRHRLRHARGQDPRAQPRLRGPRPRLARGGAAAALLAAPSVRASPRSTSCGPRRTWRSPRGCASGCVEPRVQLVDVRQGRHAPGARPGGVAADRPLRLRGARARARRPQGPAARALLRPRALAARPEDDPARRVPAGVPLPPQPPAGA